MAGTKRERVPDYPEMVKYLTETFPEVSGKELYEDLFPNNEKAGEHKKNHNYEKPNAVYLYSTPDGKMHLFCKVRVIYGEPMPAEQFAMESRRDTKKLRANKQALLDAWEKMGA